MGNKLKEFGLKLQSTVWSRRAETWEAMENPGLEQVVAAVIDHCDPKERDFAVDLGCGSGQVLLPLAGSFGRIVGVDISPKMIELLDEKSKRFGLTNVEGMVAPLQKLSFPPASVDLVVSNYVLHHLSDDEKAALIRSAAKWLKPGGMIVIGDMMFGRGMTSEDRAIIKSKVTQFLKMGPPGWWRIAKNAGRFIFRLQEKPISQAAWTRIFEGAGLLDISITPVVNEAAVIVGRCS
ncbi:MAG: methyltransferase domain-containing protein [Acidimicrobiaceae bacterium]|nr:methyltransferase domain-containing protein [Acidimicrobiaceae bacterium]